MRDRLLFAILSAFLLSTSPSVFAADHRDAPTIDDYSAIDINDVFMFRHPTDPNRLVVAVTTQAVADPLFGSSYHFQPNALYQINFTTRRDAHPTDSINFVFGPFGNNPACPAPQPACQVYEARFPDGAKVRGFATQGTSASTHLAPDIQDEPGPDGLIRVFAGPREDPFFFDLVGFNRAVAAGNPSLFTGVDAFKGKNVNAIVIEFPVTMVFPSKACKAAVPNTPCGVWAVTYLGAFDFDDPKKFEKHPEKLKQVDRMGNPAVNTALIPAAFKDAFNFGQPEDDAKDFAGVILPQILALDKKFGVCTGDVTDVGTCNPNTQFLAAVAVPDVLHFSSTQDDGFPNGRRPFDHTTDILIGLILNIQGGFTDGTLAKHYCLASPDFPTEAPVFPYLGPPLQLGAGPNPTFTPQMCP